MIRLISENQKFLGFAGFSSLIGLMLRRSVRGSVRCSTNETVHLAISAILRYGMLFFLSLLFSGPKNSFVIDNY
jgi:hypothetical protein